MKCLLDYYINYNNRGKPANTASASSTPVQDKESAITAHQGSTRNCANARRSSNAQDNISATCVSLYSKNRSKNKNYSFKYIIL